jgi:hypothetical protein
MNLVEALECHFGPINDWPSDILEYLFTNYPTMINAAYKLKRVVAFFYGNCIPIDLVCQFFHACDGMTSRQITQVFHECYHKWRRS